MLDREQGSLSIEATLVCTVFLLLLLFFFSLIYAYHGERISFEKATLYVLEANHEFLGEGDFEKKLASRLVEIKKGYTFCALKRVEEAFPYKENGFSAPLEEIVFITDYGKMYHLPSCPTVKKSLRPVIKKTVPELSPCSLCH